jgi:hypothetical protein
MPLVSHHPHTLVYTCFLSEKPKQNCIVYMKRNKYAESKEIVRIRYKEPLKDVEAPEITYTFNMHALGSLIILLYLCA